MVAKKMGRRIYLVVRFLMAGMHEVKGPEGRACLVLHFSP